MLITGAWPNIADSARDAEALAEVDCVVRLISEIRAVRSEMNVPAGAKIALMAKGASETTRARMAAHSAAIERLARIDGVTYLEDDIPKGAISTVLDEATLALPLADVIDLDAERARLSKEIDKLAKEITGYDKKLANKAFLAKAPEDVVAEQHERRSDASEAKAKLEAALERLSAA